MKLTEDEKLLYDSCEEYVTRFIATYCIHSSTPVMCEGDDNILELCNRCTYYNPLTDHSVDPIAK